MMTFQQTFEYVNTHPELVRLYCKREQIHRNLSRIHSKRLLTNLDVVKNRRLLKWVRRWHATNDKIHKVRNMLIDRAAQNNRASESVRTGNYFSQCRVGFEDVSIFHHPNIRELQRRDKKRAIKYLNSMGVYTFNRFVTRSN